MRKICSSFWDGMGLLNLVCISLPFFTNDVSEGYSIEKMILDSAPNPEMFDLFHITPDGEAMIMTEFDILMTLKQYKEIHMPNQSPSRERRKAKRDFITRWSNCRVYYEMTDTITSENDIKTIKDAMAEWTKYTCLTFKESTSASRRIQFQDGEGCSSYIGMQEKPQPIFLAKGCRTKAIIAHEIGHAIGWYHEQSRPDRDDYISINLENTPKRYRSNFNKYSDNRINTYNVSYDYLSLMHYGSDAFKSSITTLDPDFQDKIGQRSGLSFKDIKLANLMYECPIIMACYSRSKPMSCPHNGFVLYKDYKGEGRCQCWCDSGNVNDPLVLCSNIDRTSTSPQPKPQPTTESPVKRICYDVRDDCKSLSAKGYCRSKIDLMMGVCALTCDFCGKGDNMCMDHDMGCAIMAASGWCKAEGQQAIMEEMCPASCGKCDELPDPCKIQQEMLGTSPGNGDPSNTGTGTLPRSTFLISIILFVLVVN